MAAPPQITTKDMSGKFTLNKSLSDSSDDILRLQGVSWFKRRAIALFTPILYITHVADAEQEHIDIVETLSGGQLGTLRETYELDWTPHEKSHELFGAITGKSRRASVDEVEEVFLSEHWAEDTLTDGVIMCDYWSTPGKNAHVWTAVQTWGFAVVNGERRYVRRTVFTSPKKQDGPIHVRFVYDYAGQIEGSSGRE